MIQAIHVDRFNLCQEGRILTLNDKGYGPHGSAMNNPFPLPYGQLSSPKEIDYFNDALIDHFFELIRQSKFTDKPSRFSCWFGVDPTDPDPLRWAYRDGFCNHPVWILESDRFFKADSKLLSFTSLGPDTRTYFNPEMMLLNAEYYWNGKTLGDLLHDASETPVDPSLLVPDWELILVPPIRVKKRIL